MRELRVTTRFERDLKKIPFEIVVMFNVRIQVLRRQALEKTFRVKKLQGVTPPLWRIRIGSYRLVYQFDNETLVLHRIGHRKDVYR